MSRQRLRPGRARRLDQPLPALPGHRHRPRRWNRSRCDCLRSIEDRLITDGVVPLVATTAVDVALYILNQKRAHLKDIEQRYRIPITVTADENLHISQFVIERSAESVTGVGESTVVHMDWAHHEPSPAPAVRVRRNGCRGRPPPVEAPPPQAPRPWRRAGVRGTGGRSRLCRRAIRAGRGRAGAGGGPRGAARGRRRRCTKPQAPPPRAAWRPSRQVWSAARACRRRGRNKRRGAERSAARS